MNKMKTNTYLFANGPAFNQDKKEEHGLVIRVKNARIIKKRTKTQWLVVSGPIYVLTRIIMRWWQGSVLKHAGGNSDQLKNTIISSDVEPVSMGAVRRFPFMDLPSIQVLNQSPFQQLLSLGSGGCIDRVNPATGQSDCARRANLCFDQLYQSVPGAAMA